MMDWNDHMSAGGWAFSILGTLIVLALIAGVIVWLVTELRRRSADASAPPLAILDRRLASGELTIDQYQQMREAINDGAAPRGREAPPPRPVVTPR